MNPLISGFLKSLDFGKPQFFKNMGVIPLFSTSSSGPRYLTLKEALDKKLLKVTEITHSGCVPELMVVNRAKLPVLLLDGEELLGAKQNRVLNTTVLLKKLSETIIPVSCTEQGRWSYSSAEFGDSGHVVHHKMRSSKARSVRESLELTGEFRSDQGEVWTCINKLQADAGVPSPTSAMSDVFEARKSDLEDCLAAIPRLEGQRGLLVIINEFVVGFDLLSQEAAYRILHPKLVKSFAMDALLQKGKKPKKPNDPAKAFLELVRSSSEKKFKSIGHGWDYRFEADGIVGSALLYRQKAIHTAFFRLDENVRDSGMSSFRNRVRYRMI